MGCRVKGMTTQEYRATYDYRTEYFKQNPGLPGGIWMCSQCHKLIFGKQNVVVDHIFPLNKGGLNHVSNCTACCQACNSAKSDIVDERVTRGRSFKMVEQTVFGASKGVGAMAALGLGIAADAVSNPNKSKLKSKKKRGLLRFIFKPIGLCLNIVTYPLRCGTLLSRLLFLSAYALIIMYYLASKTQLLNAWLY